ncbi:hypothetical protein, partial [Lactiplantibacillus plantarum]|uniref:hypothetical protein n=1 Tax=Lactiplantibacillus plantarum TaxID=1590 RepID=UPI0027199F8B
FYRDFGLFFFLINFFCFGKLGELICYYFLIGWEVGNFFCFNGQSNKAGLIGFIGVTLSVFCWAG